MYVDKGVLVASASARRRVVVVGSSGGSTVQFPAPVEFLEALSQQLARISQGAAVVAAQFVCCEVALDDATPRSPASLWIVDASVSPEPKCVLRAELVAVNRRARELDAALARSVPGFDAVVALSADARAGGANGDVLRAAGAAGLPVAGTGGSGLSVAAQQYGCRLCGNAGGSVATSNRTKAIGIAASLAGAWHEHYTPATFDAKTAPHLRTVVNELLPALVGVAVVRRFVSLDTGLAAPAVGAFSAIRYAGGDLGPVAALAGGILGALCAGSPAAALLASIAYAFAAPHALALCARGRAPATAANFVVAGGLPVVLGGLWWLLLVGPVAWLTSVGRRIIRRLLGNAILNAAAAAGVQYGARRGWYHVYILPLICLEHERGDLACLGALDALALVCVGCGACAAQLAQPRPRPTKREADADQALALRGLLVGGICGDYVEACHPFLARDPILDGATYAGSVLAALVSAGSASSAYLPVPLSFLAAERPGRFLFGVVVAFGVPFAAGCVSNMKAARENPAGVVRRGSASAAAGVAAGIESKTH